MCLITALLSVVCITYMYCQHVCHMCIPHVRNISLSFLPPHVYVR